MAFNPNIKRQENTSIDIDKRVNSFDEVIIPLNKEEILLETNRCLSCPKPRCVEGCPIHLPIPQMIKFVNEGKEKEAYQLINDVSPLSGICSIVCDHHSQCEGNCVRGIKDKPVNIGSIHRYVAYLNENYEIKVNNSKKEHIAVIGAGPAGLAAAESAKNAGAEKVIIVERDIHAGGILIASGIIDDMEGPCREKLEETGFRCLETIRDGCWSAIAAQRVL